MAAIGEPYFKNLRDLGGLTCQDGASIKPGKIYRTPKLYCKTPEEKAVVDGLHLDYIVDFREKSEYQEKPDYVPAGCIYLPVEMYHGYKLITVSNLSKLRVFLLKGKREDKVLAEKLRSYEEMPFSPAMFDVFRLMDEGKTFAFHCTEGKDRTGVCAALIEYCLGRSKDDILEEYLKSNVYRPRKDRSNMKYLGCSQHLIELVAFCESCHEELFQRSLDTILSRYDSIDDYLWNWYGVNDARKATWRALYCE